MLSLSLEIFLVFVSIVFYAFFSLAETSVLTVRKSRLSELIEDEDTPEKTKRRANAVLALKSQPEEFLAAVQIGSGFFAIVAAIFTGFFAIEELAQLLYANFTISSGLSVFLGITFSVLILLALILTFGGLIPKSIALHQNVKISLALGEFLLKSIKILKPFIHFPVLLANTFLKPFKDRASFTESRISEEEFRVMLEEGARTGVLDKTENELLENILDFRETTAREVMVPRTKIVAIDIQSPRIKVIEKLIAEGYTRLPVYQDTIDNIIGVVYSKDVLALIEHPDLIILFDIIRPTMFVPETKLIAELLRELQQRKFHIAIVIDEFGGTAGIVTLEDIIEEIVGEIEDEYDEEMPMIWDPEQGHLTLPANLSTPNANMHLAEYFGDFQIPEHQEYDSLGGYVTSLFGHIPETGETSETDGVTIVVLKRTPKEVLQVRFENHRPTTTPEEEQQV
jgi:CBS domain containing-hemolysin-like protein